MAAGFAVWLLTLLGAPPPPTSVETHSPEVEWSTPEPSSLRSVLGTQWKAEVGRFELLATNHEEWTRPSLSPDGSRVYIGTGEGVLQARSVQDGTLLWKREKLGAIGSDMLEHRSIVVVGSDSDLLALDIGRGQERWRVELGGRIGGEITRTGTVAIIPVRPNAFIAVDLVAGQRVWQVKRPTPEGLTVRGQAPPTVLRQRGTAYLGFSDGSLAAVALKDGSTRWTQTLGDPGEFFADIDAAPIPLGRGEGLLVAAYNTSLFRLDADSGRIEWSRALPRIMGLARAPRGLVVASQGDGQVLGIQPSEGRVIWRYRMAQGAPTAPRVLEGEWAIVASSRGPMSLLSVRDGRPTQLVSPGTGSSVPPAVLGRNVVLLSNGGLVLAMRSGSPHQVILR